MRVFKPFLSLLLGLELLPVLAPPAEAAVPRIRITCGMQVQQDARLYLAKDLVCPASGVIVAQEQGEPGPVPHVVVDLQGHTLAGSGRGEGIHAISAYVQVVNGRLKNWDMGVVGDRDTRTRNLALVDNRIGFFCNGNCVADKTLFEGNRGTGFYEGEADGGLVTRSTFVHNKVGASANFIWPLSVASSTFVANEVGVQANGARVSVATSLFVKNQTAVRVITNDDTWPCADLQRDVFVGNGVNLDGPRCPA